MLSIWDRKRTVSPHIPFLLRGLALGAFLFVVLRCAWISDDAYITIRTADNFVHGYGLRWNVSERVQAFTHPAWLACIILGRLLTGEFYFSCLFLSVTLSLAAAALVAFRLCESAVGGAIALVFLLCSKSFVDYSTGGLEAPLSYLFFAIFLFHHFNSQPGAIRSLAMGLLCGMAYVNRPDSILLYIPCIVPLLFTGRKNATFTVLACAAPVIVWTAFSLFYYGMPFPNTAYAKLGHGVGRVELVIQGIIYLLASARLDPMLALAGICVGVMARLWTPKERHVLLGIAVALIYTVWIGGDFMAGRFLTLPYLAMTVIVARHIQNASLMIRSIPCVAAVGFALMPPYGPLLSGGNYGDVPLYAVSGVVCERQRYYAASGLLRYLEMKTPPPIWPDRESARDGHDLGLQTTNTVVVGGTIGFMGYFAGPRVHIVDECALADPLLARLPARPNPDWRIGHFDRSIPSGYQESLMTDENHIQDPYVRGLYHDIRLATRSELLSRGRLGAIWRLMFVNFTPEYRKFRDSYEKTDPPDSAPSSLRHRILLRFFPRSTQ